VSVVMAAWSLSFRRKPGIQWRAWTAKSLGPGLRRESRGR
jgi:hypothetical protein